MDIAAWRPGRKKIEVSVGMTMAADNVLYRAGYHVHIKAVKEALDAAVQNYYEQDREWEEAT